MHSASDLSCQRDPVGLDGIMSRHHVLRRQPWPRIREGAPFCVNSRSVALLFYQGGTVLCQGVMDP